MGLEKIRQSVLAEAKAEATRLVDSARKNKANLLAAQKEAAEEEFDRLCRLRMQAIEEEYNRKLIQLKGAAGKQILDKRNALLKGLFEEAKREILAWPSEKYARVMRRLVEKAADDNEGKIRVHPEDNGVFQSVLSELNQDRDRARVTLDETAPLPQRGGFVFVSASFEVDQTLDAMLRDVEHEMLPAVASGLFNG
jgi:V/A-type H+/Na+-transporting ATPase subunit E